MNFYKRYINGEFEKVYQEIHALGIQAFSPVLFPEIDKILTETFERVAFNLDVIHSELIKIGYHFLSNTVRAKPLKKTQEILSILEATIADIGYIPLSLQYFYKIVGGVDFVWNYNKFDLFLWDMADPIQIYTLDYVYDVLAGEYWKEDIQDYMNDDAINCAFIELSADDLHKDNVSGGMPYSLQITKNKSVDSKLLFEANETTFIDYLRKNFEYGGFLGNPQEESFQQFVKSVKPKLKPI